MSMILAQMTFGEALGSPTWEPLGRFGSPGFIVMYTVLIALWRIYSDVRGILKPIREAWEGGDFKMVIKLVQEAIPVILSAIEKARGVIPVSTPIPQEVVQKPAPTTVDDPLENACRQYAAADAAGDKELASFWAKRYNELKPKS